MSVKVMQCAAGSFKLSRFPENSPQSLQAWDAADVLLINAAWDKQQHLNAPVVWVLNDQFGAITTALHACQPYLISDSFSAHQACRDNYQRNRLALEQSQLLDSLTLPEPPPDMVLFRLPKNLALLEYQLSVIKNRLKSDTIVIGTSMCKHLQRSMVDMINQQLGPCQPSLASKKARLLPCQPDSSLVTAAKADLLSYRIPELQLTLVNYPNLFSRERLDIGSRFLLENLPEHIHARHIVDMACGNGVLGIAAGQRAPEAKLSFTDESYMAIASAKHNAAENLGSARKMAFYSTHCLQGLPDQSADLVINNPPFHQQHVVGDYIARQMFKDAHRVLESGGRLLVVANRQLGYHIRLKQLFGQCTTLKGNPKFVLLEAVKQ